MIERVMNYSIQQKIMYEIIPIDDRSTDKTKEILLSLKNQFKDIVKPVFRKKDTEEKGNTMGKALIEGTRKATGDYIIWTMGDLADDTKSYGEIFKKLTEGYDIVFGSRYMPGGSRGNLDPLKAFLSSWGTILAKLLFGIPVHDITNAFRGFNKTVFQSINLTSSGFSISPEFAIKAHLSGFKLGEIPTLYTNRKEGISSFKIYSMTISYLKTYIELFLEYKIKKTTQILHNKI